MTVPAWWNERRYGLFVHSGIATVPSFSPIGESADWYWSHLGTDALPGAGPHPSPMAEVLAYHRDRWPHVERYDDFIPFLTYHRFDADEPVELALDAGMSYLVHVAKHHDGFCWWDAPGTTRTSVRNGPRRDILADVAAACRRHGVQFGTSYSLLDWAEPRSARPGYVDPGYIDPGYIDPGYIDPGYIDAVFHPQVVDLVERYGSHILWADCDQPRQGPTEHSPDTWRIAELFDRAQDLADAQGIEVVFNDRWGHPKPSFVTIDDDPPADIEPRAWELTRALGASPCRNRAERAEQLLTTGGLFDLLTGVIAKGGNLLVDVGPSVDGTISEIQKRPLREVGEWVNDHLDVIHASRPFETWGDAQVRFVRVADYVVALDLAAGAEVVLAGLAPDRYAVTSIEADDGAPLHWEQHRGGVSVSRIDRSPVGLAGAYRIRLQPAVETIRLFDASEAALKPLQHLLDRAIAGAVVELPEGRYQGPVTVPAGVTLRGSGWDRTALVGSGLVGSGLVGSGLVGSGLVGRGGTIATLEGGARIEHIHLTNASPVAGTVAAATIRGAGAAVVDCRCDGQVVVNADDAAVVSVIGVGVVGTAERTTVERCSFKGTRWQIGIELTGGAGHRIHGNEMVDHLCAVRLDSVNSSVVSENRLESRWWGVHALRCDHVEVVNNNIRNTMRAVDVDGGNGSIVAGNWVADGDSGTLIEFGANETSVLDNHVERCRIGVLVWDAPTTRIGANTFVDLHEENPIVHGPDTDSE